MKHVTRNKEQGFTLVEALVATAVFAFTVSSILGSYMAVLRLDTRSRAQRAVADDARFIMDYISKEVRDGSIDFPSYSSNAEYDTDIFLITQSGDSERIYCNGQDLSVSKATSTGNLNSPRVAVTNCQLIVRPTGNPFAGGGSPNIHPHVRVILQLTYSYNDRDQVKMDLESTFSTLYYPARP